MAVTTATAWQYWQDTTTASTTDTTVWVQWVYASDATSTTASTAATDTAVWYGWTTPPAPTAAARKRQAELEKKAKEERDRAEASLREHLSEEQARQLEKENGFDVEGQSGQRYHIARGYAGNVYSLDKRRRRLAKHCIHPDEAVPDADVMLAQMLWIRWNEEAFLKIANITRLAA